MNPRSTGQPFPGATGPDGTPYPQKVARGEVRGSSIVHKFGHRAGVVTLADIWNGTDAAYTYPTAAAPLYICSDNNADTHEITVQGLDGTGAAITVVKSLTGQTPVLLGGADQVRTFRAWCSEAAVWPLVAAGVAGNVYIFEGGAAVGGVPTVSNTIRAKVEAEHQQTLMALYTVPLGHSAYLYQIWANGARTTAATATAAEFELQAREPGGSFRTKLTWGWHNYGGAFQEMYNCPDRFGPLTDLKVICRAATAAINAGGGFDVMLELD